jgi:probable HAF family extracellular repeat protein
MSQKKFGNETWQRATLWMPNNVPMDLGTFGGPYAEAFGVNDNGQVVGWAWNAQWRQRAFVWSSTTGMIDIGTLGGVSASAADINEQGVVVGVADTAAGAQRAYMWTPTSPATGVMVELPTPPNALSAYATAVNNSGAAVGNAFLETCDGAGLLWKNGQVYDVNTLVMPGSGWVIDGASDIADDGRIAASGRLNGGPYHAVLLVPVKAVNGARR